MKKIRFICSIILFCSIIVTSSVTTEAALRIQDIGEELVIVIDPGHGGENLGTIENGFLEKEMTLITAQAMYDELSLYDDIKVYMTRTEDVDLSLKARAEYAAGVNADFLFSLHYNASGNHDRYGAEIWIPSQPAFHSYGYQFGTVFLEEMQELGLFLRGIKTKLNKEKEDYYGIIRESVALSVPSAILEHCHVDHSQDEVFCDTDEELISFGKADATAVAKYFGLKSSVLNVDYSEEDILPNVDKNSTVDYILWDETPPDVCMIELVNAERVEDIVNVSLTVSAVDYDSMLLYYDYSIDGGATYSDLQIWPENDALKGTYKDTAELDLHIPYEGKIPELILRCYNLYDSSTESNPLRIPISLSATVSEENNAPLSAEKDEEKKEDKKTPGTTTFMPAMKEQDESGGDTVSFVGFLKLCLIIVILIFFAVIVSQSMAYSRRKRRRRQRKNDVGNNRNHPR